MTKLLVRLDAGPAGLGHAVRTSGLLARLEPRPDLVLAGQGEGLDAWFPGIRRVDCASPQDLAALCRGEKPDALLFDLPSYQPALFDAAGGIPTICVDDWGGPMPADLAINGTVIGAYHHYPQAGRVLAGGAYTLIRPAFGDTPWSDPAEASVVGVIGSGERARDWAHLLLDADRAGWGPTTLIVGNAFPDRAGFAAAAVKRGIEVRHGLDAASMASCLARSMVALITGGMVVYEALAVGVPAVVFPQLDNMLVETEFLSGAGCIVDLGFQGGMSRPAVSQAVSALIADRTQRREMSRRQTAMVDGKGLERAAQAVSRFLAGDTP